jgi:hypothetical protein
MLVFDEVEAWAKQDMVGRTATVQKTTEETWKFVLDGLESGKTAETCRNSKIALNLCYR